MQVKDLGEFGLIQRISDKFQSPDQQGFIGIGDDCSVIPKDDLNSYLVTCDTLIENIHFLTPNIEPNDLGYKSLAVNLSDIAAMGGIPEYAFLSMALPVETDTAWIDKFLDGLHDLAVREHVVLAGGDTTKSPGNIAITITVIGIIETGNIKRRTGAEPGDKLFVTGFTGDSGGGLRLLTEGHKNETDQSVTDLIRAHNRPKVYTGEGIWLGTLPAVHAMIDLSDGLASDARHIAESSRVAIRIDLDEVPVSENLQIKAGEYGWDTTELVISAGEDYSLLFAADASESEQIQAAYFEKFGESLNCIGEIREGEGVDFYRKGKKVKKPYHGFDHFKK